MKTIESRSRTFLNESSRGLIATTLALLMIPCGQPGLFAQNAPPPPQGNYGGPAPQGNYGGPPPQDNYGPPPGNYAPLGAEQLNQLVAPIALYPDSLVAQVLTAATYPQQVTEANNWIGQTGNMPPEQRAQAADTMQWDPSIKALTAFPSVLNNMGRNYNWTAALGNAYYNQPGDVMNAVQAMRMRAQQAGTLRSDNHYRVMGNGGLVVIEPVDPAFVYVPYYDPWAIYGGPIVPWRGYYWGGPPRGVVFAAGLGIGFAAGISIGLFSHYGWGYNHWEPNWHGGVVVYNHNTYISRSTTVINRGYFGGNNRGVYERSGPGVPNNFRPAVTAQSAAFRAGQGRPGEFRNSNYANRPAPAVQGSPAGRQFGQPAQSGAYNRGQAPVNNNQPGTYNRGQAPATNQAPRQFGQPRTQTPAAQPGQQPRTYPSTQGSPRPAPTAPTPQVQRTPQGNNGGGTYRQQHMNGPVGAGASPRPQAAPSSPRPQAPAPARQPAAAPQVHQGGGGGQQHSAPQPHSQGGHSEHKR